MCGKLGRRRETITFMDGPGNDDNGVGQSREEKHGSWRRCTVSEVWGVMESGESEECR